MDYKVFGHCSSFFLFIVSLNSNEKLIQITYCDVNAIVKKKKKVFYP